MLMDTFGGELSALDLDRWISKSGDSFDFYFPKVSSYFQTGTDALAASILAIHKTLEAKTLWVPMHFCESTLDRLLLKVGPNISFKRYSSFKEIGARGPNDMVLFVHFNHYDIEITKYIEEASESERVFYIEDFVQAPFHLKQRKARYAFNCLRKGLAKDVAMAWGDFSQVLIQSSEGSGFAEIISLARKTKDSNRNENESGFLRLFSEASRQLYSSEIFAAQTKDIAHAKSLDWISIESVRKANYQTLVQLLNPVSEIEILPGDSMFLMFRSQRRDEFRTYCANQRMFFPVHWLDSNTLLAKEVISVVIDQRYSDLQMRVMGKNILRFFGL
jgi:hypothetical protein